MGKLRADLMGAPGMQLHRHQAQIVHRGEAFVVPKRLFHVFFRADPL